MSHLSTTIKLAFGDPSSNDVIWEDMHQTSLFAAQNHYTLSIKLPDGRRRDFEWKGTHDVYALSTNANKTARKLDDVAYKIDSEHLKLAEKGTNEVVVRLVHCPLLDGGHIKKRGDFEIRKDFGGEVWD
jgi:hypothetical protein